MLIFLEKDLNKTDVNKIMHEIERMGISPHLISAENQPIIEIADSYNLKDNQSLLSMKGIAQIIQNESAYPLADKANHSEKTVIKINDQTIGGGNFTLIAGPCAVESAQQMVEIAGFLSAQGVKFLRAGAFKPRTSPYSFQGLGRDGLKILNDIKSQTSMIIVTEAMDILLLEEVAQTADIIQIGTRNMQNFPLLQQAGRLNKPILLKRGMGATLKEWLLAAEYILSSGNRQVILCERGIRAFDNHSRTFLDLGAIPVLNELTHLPLIVDPSHAAGFNLRVPPLARAALAVDADGLMVEVHSDPTQAKSDGLQSITFQQFSKLKTELDLIATALNRKVI